MINLAFDIIGTIGVMFCLAAFYMVQSERVSPQQLTYPMLNLIGAVLLLISLMWNWNTPSVIIEIAWITISIYGIHRILKEQRDAKE